MVQSAQLTENEYRKLIQIAFDRVEAAFENVDPDLAECEQGLGTIAILFPNGTKCILSTQPSVRQLWVAVASKGIAHHFIYDGANWVDDKGKGLEFYQFLNSYLKEMTGIAFAIGG